MMAIVCQPSCIMRKNARSGSMLGKSFFAAIHITNNPAIGSNIAKLLIHVPLLAVLPDSEAKTL